eukprot:SAG11_NODE_36953_length_259_cov_0.643750_1_plen_63_part_01
MGPSSGLITEQLAMAGLTVSLCRRPPGAGAAAPAGAAEQADGTGFDLWGEATTLCVEYLASNA